MNIAIRKATEADILQLQELYFETITAINSRDYNLQQIRAWSSTADRTESLIKKIREQHFYVAENDDPIIIGFTSLTNSGYLDMMYVHKDFQNKGIAKVLLQKIMEKAKALQISTLETEASITAKPFFEKHGFKIIKEQIVFINEVGLTNFKMQWQQILK